MSYRSFKHLLGETSLERKCRFIFGGGILLLVTVSFYWYGRQTEKLVVGQNFEAARALVHPVLNDIHFRSFNKDGFLTHLSDELSFAEIRPRDTSARFRYRVLSPYSDDPDKRPRDEKERNVLERFLKAARNEVAFARANAISRPMVFADGTEKTVADIVNATGDDGRKWYRYVEAIQYTAQCVGVCHAFRTNERGLSVDNKVGDLAAAFVIELPMDRVRKAIHQNRAILISAALVTAILAMVASYVIVRYVIVKPVNHLRDVSDAIAAGNLKVRSHIHTGDEFEELSHAFNRMLHSLMNMQEELRDVNRDLDRKVDELARANLALFEMNNLKSEFLATMSHELRTPLNSIIGFSEVLASSEQLSDRQRRYAGNIMNSGRNLLSLINDILDLAKIESGKMEVHVADCSPRDLCETLAANMREAAERKSIDLELELDEGLPLLRQDVGKMRQIIYNLLSNAIKFTPEGGRVVLRAYPEGRDVVIQVEDTGIGIPEEDQEVVFEKFRQLRGGRQAEGVLVREHEGTGLGLSIVRELCQLLRGGVMLSSQPGMGSVFTVRLPQRLSERDAYAVRLTRDDVDLTKAGLVAPRPGSGSGSVSGVRDGFGGSAY